MTHAEIFINHSSIINPMSVVIPSSYKKLLGIQDTNTYLWYKASPYSAELLLIQGELIVFNSKLPAAFFMIDKENEVPNYYQPTVLFVAQVRDFIKNRKSYISTDDIFYWFILQAQFSPFTLPDDLRDRMKYIISSTPEIVMFMRRQRIMSPIQLKNSEAFMLEAYEQQKETRRRELDIVDEPDEYMQLETEIKQSDTKASYSTNRNKPTEDMGSTVSSISIKEKANPTIKQIKISLGLTLVNSRQEKYTLLMYGSRESIFTRIQTRCIIFNSFLVVRYQSYGGESQYSPNIISMGIYSYSNFVQFSSVNLWTRP
jgi:hypothetical protein